MGTPTGTSAAAGREPALTGLLRGRIREVGMLIEQRGEAALAGTSLSLPLNHLLDAVVAEPGVTVTAIAARVRKSQQAMSQAADRLERLGFIERRVGSGRAVGLYATEEGRAASADGVRRELAAEERTRQILGDAQFEQLMSALEVARDCLTRDASGAGGAVGSH
ncbi:MAG TPA: MarR family winged helix-turn-helix transcriptional regulator [Pseudolysinimonas sp.]|nr:MarR family winged helix-turn-helix transcriptional regulator [Pseudolysinimonas sp.]